MFANLLPYLVGAFSALAGASITGFFTLWTSRQAHKRQLERDRLEHERKLEITQLEYERSKRDAKKERIRQEYITVLDAIISVQEAIEQIPILSGWLPIQEVNSQVASTLRSAVTKLDTVRFALLIDDQNEEEALTGYVVEVLKSLSIIYEKIAPSDSKEQEALERFPLAGDMALEDMLSSITRMRKQLPKRIAEL